ncbi:NAD-dependent epimerase/dehydratase family protein [Pedobacter sp. BS3]|uniref:NAD-dependent epimerase/dehydratase family protein n=1 Tax=Pedobacter sp. BS3 TaxID=2567937 RepID=UPI0011EC20F1|nr:NAD-dependent epimerase/dehydratase family protein [Pedobacter sp. BS3]TZF82118.1 NAD-dependent epimerase/dehydratase family protein [Pedobacter sp. BS3]
MILVTGATGFLGSELVKQLTDQGKAVRALKRQDSVIPVFLQNNPAITWAEADILDYFALEDAFEGISYVYHCAAFISFNPADKRKLHHINIEGTANVVNLCLQKNVEKLVHVSSVAAVGNAKPGNLTTEKNHWEYDGKQHDYAISKYESEMEVWRGVAEGLNAVIINPSLIIGANAGISGSGQLFDMVRKGLKFYTEGGTGFVDVTDVARAMIQLMESDIRQERFLVNAENRSYRDIFSLTASHFGLQPPTIKLRKWMLSLAWRAAKLVSLFNRKAPGLTKYTAASALVKHYYSNEKIRQAIGIEFKPVNVSIQEICSNLQTIY